MAFVIWLPYCEASCGKADTFICAVSIVCRHIAAYLPRIFRLIAD